MSLARSITANAFTRDWTVSGGYPEVAHGRYVNRTAEHSLACTPGDISHPVCVTQLTLLTVPPPIADIACRLAAV